MVDARPGTPHSSGDADRQGTGTVAVRMPVQTAGGRAAVVIGLAGAIALPQARELQARALDAMRVGHRRIAVDLTEVTDVGGGLLGALLHIRRRLAPIDGELSVIVAGPPARDVVHTAGPNVLLRVEIAGGGRRARAPQQPSVATVRGATAPRDAVAHRTGR